MTQPYSAEEMPTILETLGYLVQERHPSHLCTISAECVERLAATLAELDGLRKDKERLDWLNGRGSEFEGMTAATPPRETVWFFKSAKHSDIRTAIDAVLASRSLPGALKEEKDNG